MKKHGHDVPARSARTPVLSAMSALNASAQRGQDDMRGFAGRARIETHHPAKHSALESLAATRWRTAFTNGLRASCTGELPVQQARNLIEGTFSHNSDSMRHDSKPRLRASALSWPAWTQRARRRRYGEDGL